MDDDRCIRGRNRSMLVRRADGRTLLVERPSLEADLWLMEFKKWPTVRTAVARICARARSRKTPVDILIAWSVRPCVLISQLAEVMIHITENPDIERSPCLGRKINANGVWIGLTMRILLFTGKGGVGKTSLAAATGVQLAKLGKRTLVMSVDPAHSVGDAFDLDIDLFSKRTSDPYPIVERLDIQEVNIQAELKRHWREVSAYVAAVLRTTGVTSIEAEELAILPGMEELSAMMYVNQYVREQRYEVIVLDCAPTAESLRFVSMPTTLDWYMKHIFPVQRSLLRAVRPIANRMSPVELPADQYFANVLDLSRRLEGIDELLCDPTITSVRLVTNAERMVLRETQRAYVYFSLYSLTVDRIMVNRLLPSEATGSFFEEWHRSQQRILAEMDEYFDPVPVHQVPLLAREVNGLERLEELAALLYAAAEDPAAVMTLERPYHFVKQDGRYLVRLPLPFATKSDVDLFKKGDELVVQIGTLRRHVGLPTSMAHLVPAKAKLEDGILTVEMKENV